MTLYKAVWLRYRLPEFMNGIRSQMKVNGISQASLARMAGVDPARISEWMKGRHEPSIESRMILDEAMDQIIEKRNK